MTPLHRIEEKIASQSRALDNLLSRMESFSKRINALAENTDTLTHAQKQVAGLADIIDDKLECLMSGVSDKPEDGVWIDGKHMSFNKYIDGLSTRGDVMVKLF